MRNRKRLTVFAILLLSLFIGTNTGAGDRGDKKPKKTGILLVTFGSSLPELERDPPLDLPLELDDIRWRTADIVVRGKGRLLDRLPLLSDIG